MYMFLSITSCRSMSCTTSLKRGIGCGGSVLVTRPSMYPCQFTCPMLPVPVVVRFRVISCIMIISPSLVMRMSSCCLAPLSVSCPKEGGCLRPSDVSSTYHLPKQRRCSRSPFHMKSLCFQDTGPNNHGAQRHQGLAQVSHVMHLCNKTYNHPLLVTTALSFVMETYNLEMVKEREKER